MVTAVIQASSQTSKNEMLYRYTCKYAPGGVINFGCTGEETQKYSYTDIALMAGLLLGSGAVDFVVTGCSSGQGMMLAMNSMPGVLCAYAPSPRDAYLFAQINNGNAVSLPLGEEYTYKGEQNLEETIRLLFSEPFGQGWPASEAERKIRDSVKLKALRSASMKGWAEFLETLGEVRLLKSAADCILTNGKDNTIKEWITRQKSQYAV